MVFGAFDACAALECGRHTCKARFCAFCLTDCGNSSNDAHAHVRQCPLNPGDSLYVAEDIWLGIVATQRQEKLEKHWRSLDEEVQGALSRDEGIRDLLLENDLERLLIFD
jgi:hypothetical protein